MAFLARWYDAWRFREVQRGRDICAGFLMLYLAHQQGIDSADVHPYLVSRGGKVPPLPEPLAAATDDLDVLLDDRASRPEVLDAIARLATVVGLPPGASAARVLGELSELFSRLTPHE